MLLARQRDGVLGRFPIWDDVRTFDGRPWRGHVDVVSGGFPCQDISSAGLRTGLKGERSGLWSEFARIVEEVRPAFVLVENSPHLRTRGLVRVLKDVDRLGYDTSRGVVGADAVGAPQERRRMWIVASADGSGERVLAQHEEVAAPPTVDGAVCSPAVAAPHGRRSKRERRSPSGVAGQQQFSFQAPDADGASLRIESGRSEWTCGPEEAAEFGGADWWPVDLIQGVDDGMAHRMDRVRATGNGQVPRVVALAWETLR